MATIIAGWFETQTAADVAIAALGRTGFEADEYSTFYLAPPGQHGELPLGENQEPAQTEGTRESGKGAIKGAVIGGVAGLAAGTVAAAATAPLGPAAAVAGAGIGAYVGSLAGAMTHSRDSQLEQASEAAPVERPAGAIVAVYADRVGDDAAIDILKANGALGIERADGQWIDGKWADFDPRTTPHLIRDTAMPRRDEPQQLR